MNKPLYRRMHVNVIIFVLALHALVVWAGVTIESPDRPLINPKSVQPIQIELIKSLTTQSSAVSEPSDSKTNLPTKSQPIVAKTEPQKEIVIATEALSIEEVSTKRLVDDVQFDTRETQNDENIEVDNSSKKLSRSDASTDQSTDEQSENNDSTEDAETDLSAMIRAITAQYNREQASQRRSLARQANRKLAEKAKLQAQIEADAVNKLLSQAAEQAEQQKERTTTELEENQRLNQDVDKDESFTRFSEDDAIWRTENQPITDVPLIVWRNVKARSGDLFIVLLELHVDKEGYITEVQLLESSGNPIIDAVATTQVRTGQLEPLTVDDIAVEAIVPISLVYEAP